MIYLIYFAILFGVLLIAVFYSGDRLKPYAKTLGLRKAALFYDQNLDELERLITPVRISSFSKAEPLIWLYISPTKQQVFLAANSRKDVRLWLQPNDFIKNVHIVLDGSKNNEFDRSNLVKNKLPPQKISLEGDFPKYFILYCENGQQITALQIVTPDIMEYVIDNDLNTDLEIVNGQIAIISRGAAKSLNSLKNSIGLCLRLDDLARQISKNQ